MIKAFLRKSRGPSLKTVVVAPLKVDKRAVVRNKLRRRTKEIIRKLRPSLKRPHDDVVVIFQKGAEKLTFEELKQKISSLLNPKP